METLSKSEVILQQKHDAYVVVENTGPVSVSIEIDGFLLAAALAAALLPRFVELLKTLIRCRRTRKHRR